MKTIFLTSLKRKIKSPLIVTNYILLPLLLIFILGNALSSAFESSEKEKIGTTIKKVETIVVNQDTGQLGTSIVGFLTNKDNNQTLNIKEFSNLDQAKKELTTGKYDQVIYLPADLSTNFQEKKSSDVSIYGTDSNIDIINITALTLSAFGDGYQVMNVLSENSSKQLQTHVYNSLLVNGSKAATTKKDSSSISAISYYGVTMLILILFYGLANTMNFIQEEYDGALGDRYLSSSVTKSSLVLGQLLTGITISVFQGGLIVLSSKVLFNVDYGEKPWVVLVTILVASIFFNALGLILGVLGRRTEAVDRIVTLMIPAMTFIGGGFVKLDMGELSELSLNEIFQKPLFNYMQQGVVDMKPVYTTLLYSAIFIALSIRLLTKRRVK
ncbi:MAG: ABC transporter permease [Streptococcaceae bacterium]|jgi:ABC-2 type transport system permease protein|nr:ABC transporter permease [Streptococcaceae bacterium]